MEELALTLEKARNDILTDVGYNDGLTDEVREELEEVIELIEAIQSKYNI